MSLGSLRKRLEKLERQSLPDGLFDNLRFKLWIPDVIPDLFYMRAKPSSFSEMADDIHPYINFFSSESLAEAFPLYRREYKKWIPATANDNEVFRINQCIYIAQECITGSLSADVALRAFKEVWRSCYGNDVKDSAFAFCNPALMSYWWGCSHTSAELDDFFGDIRQELKASIEVLS